jgi:hypothetical protein
MSSPTITIDFENGLPAHDGDIADVSTEGVAVGNMIYYEDDDQWNDTEFPGDVAAKHPEMCAFEMIRFRKSPECAAERKSRE